MLILKRISVRLSIKKGKIIIFAHIGFCFFFVHGRYCSLTQVVCFSIPSQSVLTLSLPHITQVSLAFSQPIKVDILSTCT